MRLRAGNGLVSRAQGLEAQPPEGQNVPWAIATTVTREGFWDAA